MSVQAVAAAASTRMHSNFVHSTVAVMGVRSPLLTLASGLCEVRESPEKRSEAFKINGDRFGPFRQVNDSSEGVGSGGASAVFHTDEIIQYHVGETVSALQKATLTPGGESVTVSQ